MARDAESFAKWTSAFKRLEIGKYADLELWVDQPRQRKTFLKFVEKLSPWVTNDDYIEAPGPLADPKKRVKKSQTPQLNGFLCKTSQIQTATTQKIFYKRFYSVNYETGELMVRNSPG